MNVTKIELCTLIAKKLNKEDTEKSLSALDIKDIFDMFFEEITSIMAEGYRIEIRGFGCFKPVLKKKRMGRNPRTGEQFEIPDTLTPLFKFSKEALKNFNDKATKKNAKN